MKKYNVMISATLVNNESVGLTMEIKSLAKPSTSEILKELFEYDIIPINEQVCIVSKHIIKVCVLQVEEI